MKILTIDNQKTLTTINTLANQLNTSPIEVVQQAINNYVEKIRRKNRFMSYAGILGEKEAQVMLNSIRDNRVNKNSGN